MPERDRRLRSDREQHPLPPNVWMGITVVNQEEADRDIPKLLAIDASVRFLSMEPLLGHIDLTRICIVPRVQRSPRAGIHIDALRGRYVESGMPFIGEWDIDGPYPEGAPPLSLNWVIVGGESGPGARPMHPDWACSLRDQCETAAVPFLFKQWGEYHWVERYGRC
jgi:protein gp37